ncbi:MAG: hypothetical protein ACKV22_27760 [Bryobacteraceae bacterium]
MKKAAWLVMAVVPAGWSYPLDGAARTGIRRLTGYQLANEGKIARTLALPPGALLRSGQVVLRLKGKSDSFDINGSTRQDPYLQSGLERIFGRRDPSYGIAVLDITNPADPKYAVVRGDLKRIPGSVGKLMVATGMFDAVARAYPEPAAREKFLRETVVTGDSFVHRDGKTVPFFNSGDKAIVNRRLEIGDRFNLWEWMDHMLSQSSNAAAAFTWKQAMLLREFGKAYPVPKDQESAFFARKRELLAKSLEVNESALRAAGLDTDKLRIGTFFTSGGSSVVPGTASYACPTELLRWLIRVEQGRLVDAWSSLEIKRLLYFARPRYRYASSPALAKAAVFFKSGSLFECESGRRCTPYKGTVTNLMHSVAIVESGEKVYLVAMMSNILGVNSAVEHQIVAGEIERLIQSRPK